MHGCLFFRLDWSLNPSRRFGREAAHRSADRLSFDPHVQEKKNAFVCEKKYFLAAFGELLNTNCMQPAVSVDSWKRNSWPGNATPTGLGFGPAPRTAARSGEKQSAHRGRAAGLASGKASSHASIDVARSAVHFAALERRESAAVRRLHQQRLRLHRSWCHARYSVSRKIEIARRDRKTRSGCIAATSRIRPPRGSCRCQNCVFSVGVPVKDTRNP